MDNQQTAIRTTYFSILGNICLALIKGSAGVLGNSYALIADAIESATDSASSLMLWLGLRYAQRPPDENHPYGHGRFEALLTFLVVFFLMISAISIGIQAYANLQEPQTLPEPFTLIALVGIVTTKKAPFGTFVQRPGAFKVRSLKPRLGITVPMPLAPPLH